MRILFVCLVILFHSIIVDAKCVCYSEYDQKVLTNDFVINKESCQRYIEDKVIEHFKYPLNFCQHQDLYQMKWGCFKDDFVEKKLSLFQPNCSRMSEIIVSKSLLSSTLTSKLILEKDLYDVNKEIQQGHCHNQDLTSFERQDFSYRFEFLFNGEKEVNSFVSKYYPGKTIDDFRDSSLTIESKNDNGIFGLLQFLGLKNGDDFGFTHGQIIKISQKIPGQYVLSFEMENALFTKLIKPNGEIDEEELSKLTPKEQEIIKQGNELFTTQEGGTQVNQFFVDESFQKFILTKILEGKGIRYSIAGGRHVINTKDIDKNFFLSSLTQQSDWHSTLIKINPKLAREYENKIQSERSKASAFVEFELEKTDRLFQTKGIRITSQNNVSTRLTGIEDASWIQATTSANLYFQNSPQSLAYKIGAKVNFKKYINNETQKSTIVDVIVAGKKHSLGLEVINQLSDDPSYLQAHPLAHEADQNTDPKLKNNSNDEIIYNLKYQYKL